jgi:hypothetical protein
MTGYRIFLLESLFLTDLLPHLCTTQHTLIGSPIVGLHNNLPCFLCTLLDGHRENNFKIPLQLLYNSLAQSKGRD